MNARGKCRNIMWRKTHPPHEKYLVYTARGLPDTFDHYMKRAKTARDFMRICEDILDNDAPLPPLRRKTRISLPISIPFLRKRKLVSLPEFRYEFQRS